MAELHVGELVRSLRQEKGVSLTALAKTAGIHPGQLSRIENGKGAPKESTIRKLAKALEVPAGRLLGEEEITPTQGPLLGKLVSLAAALPPEKLRQVIAFTRFAMRDGEEIALFGEDGSGASGSGAAFAGRGVGSGWEDTIAIRTTPEPPSDRALPIPPELVMARAWN